MATRSPRKLESHYSWLVCFCSAISNALANSMFFSFGVLLPIFMKEFNENRERTALIGSLTGGLGYASSLIAGQLCHRLSCRLCHVIGTLLCSGSLFVSSWATSMTFLFSTFCPVYGLGFSFTYVPCFLIVSLYFDKTRSFAIGLVTAGASAGFFVIGPTMEALIESIGWRNTFRTLSGVFLCTSVMSIVFDPNVEKQSPTNTATSLEPNIQLIPLWKRFTRTFSFFKLPGYFIPVTSFFFEFFSHASVPIHLVRHCEEMGVNSKMSSYLYLGIGIGSFVTRIGAGKLCEIIRPVYVNQISGVCSGICTLMLAMITSYPMLVATTLLYGIADGALYTSYNVVLLTCVEQEQRQYAYSAAFFILSIAITIGPMTTGLVADHHSYKEAFLMAGSVTIIGGLIPLFLHCFKAEQQKQQEREELLICERETVL